MKKNLLLLSLLSLCWPGSSSAVPAPEEGEPLNVLHVVASPAGQARAEYDILLATKPVVKCYNGQMTVAYTDAQAATGTTTLTFAVEDAVQLTLQAAPSDGIRRPEAAVARPLFDLSRAGIVRVSGLERGALVQVVSVGGAVVAQGRASESGTVELSIASQGRGVYVVSVNQRQTFKVMKP